jgi:hypothetical protein
LTGSLVARFSEPKKIARKVFYYQENMKHYDAKKDAKGWILDNQSCVTKI